MQEVNKRRRISFSLSKLERGPQEINSREIRLHLPFWAKWNKREFILKLTFSLPLPSSMLKLPIREHVNRKWTFCLFEQWTSCIFGQIVCIRVKTLSKTDLVATRHIKTKKGTPPGAVRLPKTSLLNLLFAWLFSSIGITPSLHNMLKDLPLSRCSCGLTPHTLISFSVHELHVPFSNF